MCCVVGGRVGFRATGGPLQYLPDPDIDRQASDAGRGSWKAVGGGRDEESKRRPPLCQPNPRAETAGKDL